MLSRNPDTHSDATFSPYHPGEWALQERVGLRNRIEQSGRRVIRGFMPDQHRELFEELPFLVVGSLDARGRPWASMLAAQPGFVSSPDSLALHIRAKPVAGNPLADNLRDGAPVGLLGIKLETRRRNRMNGWLTDVAEGGFTVRVGQSFGNCPQYIQARTHTFVKLGLVLSEPILLKQKNLLSEEAAGFVRRADTFFIASAAPDAGGGNPAQGVDVSHRGGKPGFVQHTEEGGRSVLTSPDFRGNFAFNTFGNLALNPRAGLLFVDFAQGHLLSLTGEAEVLWDDPRIREFAGAQRLLRFRLEEGVLIKDAIPLRWSAPEFAPQLAATGSWSEVSR